jgi:hypothetical protein
MPTARSAMAAGVIDGKLYVAGGRPPRGSDFAVYDPVADEWTVLPEVPTQRNHLAAAAIDGKLYVAGGRSAGRRQRDDGRPGSLRSGDEYLGGEGAAVGSAGGRQRHDRRGLPVRLRRGRERRSPRWGSSATSTSTTPAPTPGRPLLPSRWPSTASPVPVLGEWVHLAGGGTARVGAARLDPPPGLSPRWHLSLSRP